MREDRERERERREDNDARGWDRVAKCMFRNKGRAYLFNDFYAARCQKCRVTQKQHKHQPPRQEAKKTRKCVCCYINKVLHSLCDPGQDPSAAINKFQKIVPFSFSFAHFLCF
jgi:hypothetical protein